MALWLIGLGLGDERDVTLKGADAIRGADVVFLESYTSVLGVPKERLEEVYGKPIAIAYRETVESEAERIIGPAKEGKKVAFLVVGDPFCATTHTDLLIRAQDAGVPTHVVHNACIMSAAGACGLQLYNFGATVSIPFFRTEWRPDSFYDKIKYNAGGGMHTLALLGACAGARGSGAGRTGRRAPCLCTMRQRPTL
jgi:diphthine methyl ester synthase